MTMGAAITICFCFGFICIFISLLLKDKNKTIESIETEKIYKLDSLSNRISQQVVEADDAFENLNALSGDIFDELEGKYQELLFLYQLMDEKKKDVVAPEKILKDTVPESRKLQQPKVAKQKEKPVISDDAEVQGSERKKLLGHLEPRFEDIINRRDNGESIADIAKSLGVGQGEIQFILGLGNKR